MKDRIEQTLEVFNQYASLYTEKYFNVEAYHVELDLLLSALPNQEIKVLDIGCGPANLSYYLYTQNKSIHVLACDLAEEMLKIAQTKFHEAEFLKLDCREIRSLIDTYDCLLLGFCLPYLNNEECVKLIQDSVTLLNKSGWLYLSCIEGKKSLETTKSDNLKQYYYSEDFLIHLLQSCGLEIIRSRRIEASNGDIERVILAKKV